MARRFDVRCVQNYIMAYQLRWIFSGALEVKQHFSVFNGFMVSTDNMSCKVLKCVQSNLVNPNLLVPGLFLFGLKMLFNMRRSVPGHLCYGITVYSDYPHSDQASLTVCPSGP